MFTVVPVPAFSDNYIWVLAANGQAVVVDPGDAAPVIRFLRDARLELAAILVTHHHFDHVGGVEELLEDRRVPVFGPATEDIPGLSHPVSDGDKFPCAEIGAAFEVIHVPGHTQGHVAYYGPGHLFCGDTLFACGCGRLFEGSPGQMHASLTHLAALPRATAVFCAHEYTEANIRFALTVEPGNPDLLDRARTVAATRGRGLPSLPSTIADELATNSFLRTSETGVRDYASRMAGRPLDDPLSVFTILRALKDRF